MSPEGTGDQSLPERGVARRGVARRTVLRGLGGGALAAGAGGVLSACGSGIKGSGGSSSTGTITIGLVTPLTGPLAGFGSGDRFVLKTVQESSAYSKGFKVGGKNYGISVKLADTQSDPNRASQVARSLILNDHVDMIVTTSTPETTNPVAGVCEAQGVPCLSTVVPWEAWYGGLGGNPLKPTKAFTYATMFFFGMKEFAGTFLPMWDRVKTNKVFAGMFPNDADGNAFRAGFPPYAEAGGYKFIDGGAYTDGTTDFSSMLSKFKSSNAETFTNCPLPPDFNTFWKQASQQGWKPKIATVAKVLLFPADCVALGNLVLNIATDSWWGPYMPYKSSLTGMTAKELADSYQSSTGSQWLQALGSTYSLFEVAREAFTAVDDPHDKKAVAAALHKVNYSGICGPIDFAGGPAPGVGIIKPVGVQWKKGSGKYPFEMQVVDHSLNSSVPITATFEPTNA